MWFGPVLNWMLEHRLEWAEVRMGSLVYAGAVALALLFGGLRLGLNPPSGDTATIFSITPDQELDRYRDELEKRGFSSSVEMAISARADQAPLLEAVYDSLFLRHERHLGSEVSLAFWPEGAVMVLEEAEPGFIRRGRRLARESGIYLLMAYFAIPLVQPEKNGENKAVLINPSGEVEWEYLKANPVPGSPDKPGDGRLPLTETHFGRLSTVICYDMDFTALIHKAGKAGVDIMIVPAWDWEAIDPLHTRMAVFRAVENGFSMVRQTAYGLSIAVDYQGRTLAAMDHFTSDDRTMKSQVPIRGVRTVYAMIGDLFAWLCLAGVIAGIGRAMFQKRGTNLALRD